MAVNFKTIQVFFFFGIQSPVENFLMGVLLESSEQKNLH